MSRTYITDRATGTLRMFEEAEKNETRSVTDIRIRPLSSLLSEESVSRETQIFSLKEALESSSEPFPVYGDMFSYPEFIKEVLQFAGSCILHGISCEELPVNTEPRKELARILKIAMSLDLPEKNTVALCDTRIEALKNRTDIVLLPSFETNFYRYEVRNTLKEFLPEETEESHSPEKFLRSGLNPRREIEAVAQRICRTGHSSNIILCDAVNQAPIVRAVFERYGIPVSFLSETYPDLTVQRYAALLDFAIHKDTASFLNAVSCHAFTPVCPQDGLQFLNETMKDLKYPDDLLEIVRKSIFRKEATDLEPKMRKAEDFLEKIRDAYTEILSSATPEEMVRNSFRIFASNPILKDSLHMQEGLALRRTLQDALPFLKTAEDAEFLLSSLKGTCGTRMDISSLFCVVTDLTHPVSARTDSYILGCSGTSYPGFTALKGLFDESYVASIKNYPSLEKRYNAYDTQLAWIQNSALESLFYSYAANDYEGREIQPAFQIKAMFSSESRWEMQELPSPIVKPHTLSSETAKKLFFKPAEDDPAKETITGSVSTIERFFACPYSYFIQSGLHVRKKNDMEISPANIGTIQHSLFEEAVKKHAKKYAELTEKDVDNFLKPCIDVLKEIHPNLTDEINVLNIRMKNGLLHALAFLKEYENHTSFIPEKAEFDFKEEIVPGIFLRGTIDRYDFCNELVRIIDYKSSIHKLSDKEFRAGQQLQLLSYMMIAEKLTGKTPAGAFYYSLKEENLSIPAVTVNTRKKEDNVTDHLMDETEVSQEKKKAQRLHGWAFREDRVELDDDESHIVIGNKKVFTDFEEVKDALTVIYGYFKTHLENGDIALTPTKNACTFCDYAPICRYHGEVITPVEIYPGKED